MEGSLRANPKGERPTVNPSSYIDPSAVIIGPVTIGKNCYIGPNVVVRADEKDSSSGEVAPIVIGDKVNLQDGVIIHALAGTKVSIGSCTSLAHGCVVHGPCFIGDHCFVGFRAVVFKSTVGSGSMIKHGAIVEGIDTPPGKLVPTGSVMTSTEDLKKLRHVGHEEQEFMEEVVHTNVKLAEGYK